MTISEMIQKYQNNMDEIRKLDESIYDTKNKEKWQKAMLHRASRLSNLYVENNDLIQKITETPIPEDEFKDVFEKIQLMYRNNYDEAAILIPMFWKFVDVFEKEKSYERLIITLSAISYEDTEYVHRLVGGNRPDLSVHKKIMSLEKTMDFSPRIRNVFLNNYYNTIMLTADKKECVDESYIYFQKMKGFIEENESSLKQEEGGEDFIAEALASWLVADDAIEYASMETKLAFKMEAEKCFSSAMETHKDLSAIDSQIYMSYLHAKAMFGEYTYKEAIDKAMDYYQSMTQKALENEDFYFLMNVPISIERLLSHVDSIYANSIMEKLFQSVDSSWSYAIKMKLETSFVNDILVKWCIVTLKYYKTREEKENSIIRLIVKRQLPTYLHSYMVSKLAVAYFTVAYQKRPELFRAMEMDETSIQEYVRNAALLHDIGKTRICDIVNMMRRRLSDYEFQGIKNHPMYGAEMIAEEPSLMIYMDAIVGHHRFYNQKGGYPLNYVSVNSKYRIITDIITLCDCLDAATDYLGRNYNTTKKASQVFEEFRRDMGTRYNPDLVEILFESKELQETLEKITGFDRLELMYEAIENMQM